MADLYNNLDGAEAKMLNIDNARLNNQLLRANIQTVNNAVNLNNVDFLKQIPDYKGQLLDKDGGLLPLNALGGSLESAYTTILSSGNKDPRGITHAISQGMATKLNNTEEPAAKARLFTEYKDAIAALAQNEDFKEVAQQIQNNVFSNTTSHPLHGYIKENLPAIKSAIESMVDAGWIGKSYLEKNDKNSWKAENAGVDDKILDSIWDSTINAMKASETYAKNPKLLFQGTDDELVSKISSRLLV